MSSITISTEAEETFSSVSNIFIDNYMTAANGEFVKVYLYLLRLYSSNSEISVSSIADHFNLTEKDICRAIRYWVSVDVLKFNYNDAGDITGIIIMNLRPPKTREMPKESMLIIEDTEDDSNVLKAPKKPKITPKALNAKMQDDNFYNILNQAQAYSGRTITQKDTDTLLYIYDTLKFSVDLIEYLLEYCASLKKTNFSYIEKVAIGWYEAGVTTREEAMQRSQTFVSPLCRKVFKALGIANRIPTSIETTFIESWQNDMGFDEKLIIEACKRAILAKPNSATFAYVNGILESWHRNNVETISDVEALDEAFHQEQASRRKNSRAGRQHATGFASFKQADNTDELDEMTELFINEVNRK